MKKVIALILCAILCFSLVACEKNDSPPTNATTQPTTNNTAPSENEGQTDQDNQEQIDFDPDTLSNVLLDGHVININNFTQNDLKSIDYKIKDFSIWSIGNNHFDISGSSALKDKTRIRISKEKNTNAPDNPNIVLVGVESKSNCVFFKNIQIEMGQQDFVDAISDQQYDIVESSKTTYYLVHDDINTLIVTIEDEIVTEIYLVVNKSFYLYPPAGSGVHQSDKLYIDWHKENFNASDWAIANVDVNTNEDISKFVLDGITYDINLIGTSNIYDAGYDNYTSYWIAMGDNLNIYGRCFIGANKSKIKFMNDPTTNNIQVIGVERTPVEGEFFYDEDEVQIDCSFFRGVRAGMTKDEVDAALSNINFIKDGNRYIIKSKQNTLILDFSNNLLDDIKLINNTACNI